MAPACLCKRKKAEAAPAYDDENCPYGIKPSELFQLNEVRGGLQGRGEKRGRGETRRCNLQAGGGAAPPASASRPLARSRDRRKALARGRPKLRA